MPQRPPMNVSKKMNAPASAATSAFAASSSGVNGSGSGIKSKPPPLQPPPLHPPPPQTVDGGGGGAVVLPTAPNIVQEEEDADVRLAVEMAMAAAKNPHMTPEQLRKLVGGKNKQVQIVDKVEKEKQKRQQEAASEGFFATWMKGKAYVAEKAAIAKEVATQKIEEYKYKREMEMYAEDIRNDKELQELRRRLKFLNKTLKAHRLQGNRMDTRYVFKQQRLERKLIQINDKINKNKKLLTQSGFNVHEYAKAVMRASRKWHKKGTDQELALEAQLCRNMHQMLTIEKQKSKLKKSTKEIKKYLQRCKSWLSDKQALCEMQIMTLDATTHSLRVLYEDTILKQDDLIRKLKASEEFKDMDLSNIKSDFDLIPRDAPTKATLCALRGLPFTDSVRFKKEDLAKETPAAGATGGRPPPVPGGATRPPPSRHELYVEAKDDVSISSRLSDPDEDPHHGHGHHSDSASAFNFGPDAPWAASESNLMGVNEKDEDDEESPQSNAVFDLSELNSGNADKKDRSPSPDQKQPSRSSSPDNKKVSSSSKERTDSKDKDRTSSRQGASSSRPATSSKEREQQKSSSRPPANPKPPPSSSKDAGADKDRKVSPSSPSKPKVSHKTESSKTSENRSSTRPSSSSEKKSDSSSKPPGARSSSEKTESRSKSDPSAKAEPTVKTEPITRKDASEPGDESEPAEKKVASENGVSTKPIERTDATDAVQENQATDVKEVGEEREVKESIPKMESGEQEESDEKKKTSSNEMTNGSLSAEDKMQAVSEEKKHDDSTSIPAATAAGGRPATPTKSQSSESEQTVPSYVSADAEEPVSTTEGS